MVKRKHDFSEDDKIKILLWCGRHCCLCGKFSGVGIEVAHLEKNKSIDNAIPLCFNCHSSVGHYNPKHPKGKKYSTKELKATRDQIYEKHTRHLVPPIDYLLTQRSFKLPKVGFQIQNVSDTYPIKVKIRITLSQGKKTIGQPNTSGHYDGKYFWNLNPQKGVSASFTVPDKVLNKKNEPLRALVEITIYDIYDRPHKMLPEGYVKNLNSDRDWYYEPCTEELKVDNKI